MKKQSLLFFALLVCCNMLGQNPMKLTGILQPSELKSALSEGRTTLDTSNQINEETSIDSSFVQGTRDAHFFYSKYSKATNLTLLTTVVTGPLGLIPAIACSSIAPKMHNLGFPEAKLMRNSKYYEGYSQTAFSIKKQKVWKNFQYGILITIIPTFLVVNKYLLNKY